MVELKNVSFSYGELKVLEDFNLTVKDGESICLWGKSGCGKTTVLKLILGLEKANKGEISAPDKISCVFQEDRLIENLSLEKNVKLVLPKEKYQKADELINEFGLQEFKKSKVQELSGGMKRRVAIIRAIAFGGDLLILDEAFNGIDSKNREKIAKIIKREFIEKNKAVIMVTHVTADADSINAKIIKI